MKKLRIYVDTSVIGGCLDPEFSPWSNGLMKDFRIGVFRPVISDVVAAEIDRAPDSVAVAYAELLSCNPEFIEITPESTALADAYLGHGILDEKFSRDLLHIALATTGEVDVLVSWNFRHIVRLEKMRMFNAVNIELGYKPIHISSPREVTTYGSERDQSR